MIRFPRIHIAASVANRIQNIANGMRSTEAPPPHTPEVPYADDLGAAIDQAVTSPPLDVAAPQGVDDTMLAAILEGGSPLEAATLQGILDNGGKP